MVRLSMLLLSVFVTACGGPGMAAGPPAQEARLPDRPFPRPGHSPDFRGGRDAQTAVHEEFDAAARAGTLEAWNLFLARHPDNPLAPEARARRDALERKP